MYLCHVESVSVDNVMDILKKVEFWILAIGIVLCGTYLSKDAFDSALTSRHIIWCGFTCLLVISLFLRKEIPNLDIVPVALSIFLLFGLVSGIAAVNKSEWIYQSLRIFLMVVYIYAAAIVVDKKALAKILVMLGAVYFCIAQYEFIKTAYVDSKGIFCNRNPWAIAHFMILPFCYYLISDKRWKWFAIAVGIGLSVNMFLLMTRSALVGYIIFLAVIFIKDVKSRKYIFSAFAICGMFVLIFRFNRFASLETLLQRKEIWTATLRMFWDNPWGIGLGNWWLIIPLYLKGVNITDGFITGIYRHPHNDFLWILAETGFLGLAAYLGVFYFAIRRAVLRKETWIVAGLLGYMAIAFFSFPRERAFSTLMLCTLLAMTFAKGNIRFRPTGYFMVTCLVVLCIFMVCLTYRHKALCYQTRMLKTPNSTEIGGFSRWSTLSFEGIPLHWYSGVTKYNFKNDEAMVDFRKAYRYAPNNIHVLNGLGVCHAMKGNMKTAKQYFERALHLYSDYEETQRNIAKIDGIENGRR